MRKQDGMLMKGIAIVMIGIIICMAMPVYAASKTDPLAPPAVSADLLKKVNDSRQALLENQLQVMKKANEAKQRVEELLKSGKPGSQSVEALKKDMETIKESQRMLASILSDIINAITSFSTNQNILSSDSHSISEPADREGEVLIQGFDEETSQARKKETLTSHEYLDSLIELYEIKSALLAKIADTLDHVVPVN